MIKVQPAGSRLIKTETADQLSITYPPKGMLSLGGLLIIIGVGAFIGVLLLLPAACRTGEAGFVIGTFVGLLPGLVILLGGLADALNMWSVSRSAEWVTFTRRGLWGRRVRKWPTQDVTTFWVSLYQGDQDRQRCALIVCFNNGRSEDLVDAAKMDEDFRWIVAVMKDKKGALKATSPTTRVAAESAPRRLDPSVVPAAVAQRKFPTGIELTFLPLIHFKRRWWRLLGLGIAGLAAILALSSLLVWLCGSSYPLWITRVSVGIWLLILLGKTMVLKQSTVIQVLDGLVTVAQNQSRGNHQFPVGEVEFIQTFRASGDSELQFLLRGKPKLRVLRGRPAEELEWAARFLRLALKGPPDQEAAPLKMDTTVGECQVCGEKMESRVIFCAKCRTPHHEECWSYVGQCSTYGCREIRFTRV